MSVLFRIAFNSIVGGGRGGESDVVVISVETAELQQRTKYF